MPSYVDFIPPKARLVVEFGCGDGQMGRAFKALQPACRYVGFEKDESLFTQAAANIDQAELANLREVDLAHRGLGPIDCIIYHSYFADSTFAVKLKEQTTLLSSGGQILLFWDNTGYIRNISALWHGEKSLADTGIALVELTSYLQAADLIVERIVPEYSRLDDELKKSPSTQKLLAAWQEFSSSKKDNSAAHLWVKRFVIRAVRKSERKERLLLHTALGEKQICARVRIYEPHTFCATTPFVDRHEEDFNANLQIGQAYRQKILIRQRLRFIKPFAEMLPSVQRLAGSGYLIVTEMDDHPLLWLDDYKKSKFLDFIGCHMVQVSTEPLANYMRQYNEHVVVFPNELRYLPPPREYSSDDNAPVTIFFGALHREKDWAAIMPALNKVLKKYGRRVRVRVLFDKKFYEALQTDCKELLGQEYAYGFAPYSVYNDVLHHTDIALLPLLRSEFNRMKSDLKFIECAAHGAVALASPTVYEATLRDGRTGFIYRNAAEFKNRLELLIENRDRRLETAHAAYSYVKQERLLANHYEERLNCYREALAHLPELTSDLQGRLNKLINEA